MGKKWLPLESNPDVLNDFTTALGLDVSRHSFHDVFGLDEVPACVYNSSIPITSDMQRMDAESP